MSVTRVKKKEIPQMSRVRAALASMPGSGATQRLTPPAHAPEKTAEEWLVWLGGYLERMSEFLREHFKSCGDNEHKLRRYQIAASGLRFLLRNEEEE